MRTPENDFELMLKLEAVNQNENPIEREWKLDRFYEEMDALNVQEDDMQDTNEPDIPSTPKT
jgi:hypothetical protein